MRKAWVLGLVLGVAAGCVSTRGQHYLDKSVAAGALPKEGVGFLGLAVWFEELPEDFVWEVQMKLRDVSGNEVILSAPGQALVAGKKADRAPLLFSLPPGDYVHEQTALYFPKTEEDLYNVAEERLVLPVTKPLPKLSLGEGKALFLGEVKIDKAVFIPGKSSHSTRLHAVWNPRAPLTGNTWTAVRKEVPLVDLASVEAGQGDKATPLLFDQTSDTAMTTFTSGFSDVYSLVAVGADRPGFAFFDDGQERRIRVQARKMGDIYAYLLPVNKQDRVSLQGFCFHEDDPEKCPRATMVVEPLANARDFSPGEIRYRGYFGSDANAKIVARDELLPAFEQAFRGEAPFAAFRSFSLGEEPRRKADATFVFFNSQGEKDKWDPVSYPLMDAFSKTVVTCDKRLREVDPFVSNGYEFAFERMGHGRHELILSSVKGLLGPAVEVLKPCLDAELHKWQGFEEGEVAAGFGVRFK